MLDTRSSFDRLSIRQQLLVSFSILIGCVLVSTGYIQHNLQTVAQQTAWEDIDQTVQHTTLGVRAGEDARAALEGMRQRISDHRTAVIALAVGIVLIAIGLAIMLSRSIPLAVLQPIQEVADQLLATASVLSSSTQQASSAAEQNASVAQQMASGATQQSQQSADISKTLVSMSSAITQMAASAQDAAGVATETSQLTQKAGEGAEKSGQDLMSIKNVFANTTGMVKQITTSSTHITQIVETIDEFARQTNLLALNAAIEAARAGEAGRGFAVVADEVRKLSEGSAKAAQEIKLIMKTMTTQMDDAPSAVETGGSVVREGAETINQTLTLLQTIASRMSTLSSKVQEVSAGVQQQSAATEQIAKTMDSIAAVSEQNASAAQQVSASTQQQSAANQQISAAAQQVQAMAMHLQEIAGMAHSVGGIIEHWQMPERTKAQRTAEVRHTSDTQKPRIVHHLTKTYRQLMPKRPTA